MRRPGQRAFTLIEVLTVLPMLAVVLFLAFQLTHRAVRVQGGESRLLADEAMMRDLLRRVRDDAREAAAAKIEEIDGGHELTLAGERGAVRYRVSDRAVDRIEESPDGSPVTYGWKLNHVTPGLGFEFIGSSPGIVWVTYQITIPMEHGPDLQRRLAAAATVGRGGTL